MLQKFGKKLECALTAELAEKIFAEVGSSNSMAIGSMARPARWQRAAAVHRELPRIVVPIPNHGVLFRFEHWQ